MEGLEWVMVVPRWLKGSKLRPAVGGPSDLQRLIRIQTLG